MRHRIIDTIRNMKVGINLICSCEETEDASAEKKLSAKILFSSVVSNEIIKIL